MLRLPNNNVPTTSIGIGCAYLTEVFGLSRESAVIDVAYEAGARHFDVAPQYGLGTAEKMLGIALQGRRTSVTVSTKVGILPRNASSAELLLRALASPVRGLLRGRRNLTVNSYNTSSATRYARNYEPSYVNKTLESSLRSLRTDYVDAWLLHMISLEELSDELLSCLLKCRREGKTRAIGLATTREETGRIVNAFPGVFDLVQYAWSALDEPIVHQPGGPFLITHRALMRAYGPLVAWFASNPEACRRLSDVTGMDLFDRKRLSATLVGAAVAANPTGIGLVASRSVERTKLNIEAAQDPLVVSAGKRFTDALRDEEKKPSSPS